MRWTYTLGRLGETEIKLHLTFFLLLAYWAVGGYEAGGMSSAIGAVAMLIALFVCVLLHEFGHITMARRFGVRTPDVLILPIGGVARLERIPDEPPQELLIALAGPAVTLAISAALYLVLRLSGGTADIENLSPATPFVAALFRTNVLLLLFNLIPAFPMDGGRVLRALLATRMGLAPATRAAATLGQMLAGAWGRRGHAGPDARGGWRARGAAVEERQPRAAVDRAVRLPGRRQRGGGGGDATGRTRAVRGRYDGAGVSHHPGSRHPGTGGRAAPGRRAAGIP